MLRRVPYHGRDWIASQTNPCQEFIILHHYALMEAQMEWLLHLEEDQMNSKP